MTDCQDGTLVSTGDFGTVCDGFGSCQEAVTNAGGCCDEILNGGACVQQANETQCFFLGGTWNPNATCKITPTGDLECVAPQ